MVEEKPKYQYPLPRCPEDGSDMAPVFGNPFVTQKITAWKCVKCGHEVKAW